MKIIYVFVGMLILLTYFVSASYVERVIPNNVVMPNEELIVKLNVIVDEENSFYAIDEIIPSDLEVVYLGNKTSRQPMHQSVSYGHLLLYSLNATTRTYEYTVRTKWQYPNSSEQSKGEYYLYGKYMFKGSQKEQNITGDSLIKIVYCVRADIDCDGCISWTELTEDIIEWVKMEISMLQLIETFGLYQGDCYKDKIMGG